MAHKQQSPKILVTVGTTEFDPLIEYTSSPGFIKMLAENGLGELPITYQIGSTGKVTPEKGEVFRLSSNIQEVYESHSIIVTHGGAGTLLYCLANGLPGRKIIAVANETLAGNHQIELISKLRNEGYLLGFNSVSEMIDNKSKVIQFLKGETSMKQYRRPKGCLLNDLVFSKFQ